MVDTVEIEVTNPAALAALRKFCRASKELNGGPPPNKPGMSSRSAICRQHQWRKYQRPTFRYFKGHPLYFGSSVADGDRKVLFGVHCSNFQHVSELHSWLGGIFLDGQGAVLDSPLARLDMCVDLALPFPTISRALTVPKVRNVFRISQGGETQYFGSPPRQTYFYRRLVRPRDIDFPRPGIPGCPMHPVEVTRVEVRTSKHHLPVACLNDLGRIQEIYPFGHVESKEVDLAIVGAALPASEMRLLGFLSQADSMGFGAARKLYNSRTNGNFKRDIGPFLIRSLVIDLKLAWTHRTARFFAT